MPIPPMKRKTISAGQFQAKAHPEGGDGIQNRHDAQRLTAADSLAENSCGHRSDHRARQSDKDGQAEGEGSEMVDHRQLLGGAGNDSRVKTKQEAAQGPDDRTFQKI